MKFRYEVVNSALKAYYERISADESCLFIFRATFSLANNRNSAARRIPLTGKQPLLNRLFECHAQHSIQFRVPFSHVNERFHAQSEELVEWESALPGESEIYIFDAPGTPKFL